jgi:ectoine hydroxylase-related dioxygenase (phytanoyl-CoA dioxygenase family)
VTPVHAHPWNADFSWSRAETAPRRLTPQEIDRFHEDGWLVVDELVDDETLAALTSELDAIEAEVDAALKTMPDERIFIAEAGAITFSPHAVTRSPAARAVSTHPAIADLCHDLVGPDVRLYWDQIVYKKPDKPRRFPWHQDNGYTFVEPQQYLTVWLSLSDATVDAGCPWVVPGLHRGGTLEHDYVEPLGFQCFADHPDAVPAPVGRGGAVVFSSLTPHLTGPNTTDAVRKTYILQYAPDGAVKLEGDPTSAATPMRVRQDDPDRQYLVVEQGFPVA